MKVEGQAFHVPLKGVIIQQLQAGTFPSEEIMQYLLAVAWLSVSSSSRLPPKSDPATAMRVKKKSELSL